ncbi:unnamed protein product, partial [Rotaria sp. Silwood1]
VLKRLLESTTTEIKPPSRSSVDQSQLPTSIECFIYSNFTNSSECKPARRKTTTEKENCSFYTTFINIDPNNLLTKIVCSYYENSPQSIEKWRFIDGRIHLLNDRVSYLDYVSYVCKTTNNCNSLENIKNIQSTYKIEFNFDKFLGAIEPDKERIMWLTVICWLSCISLTISADVNLYGGTGTANGWEFVRDLFRENFVQGRDTGGSIAIYHQGRLVVDLAGGWFDASKTKVYDNETLQLVFSTSKGLVAIAAALCVQRGLLDYSAPVTRYWPEYGQRGKENTTVADILSHRAGVPNVLISSFDQYLNWTTMIDLLEQERPVWIPGHAQGYHALTYGWLAGELIR